MKKISVIGAGTWGIVIASLLADNGHEVLVYARNKDEAKYINDTHTHSKLSGITLNENVKVDSNLENVAKNRDAIIFAIPSVAFRDVVHNTIPYLKGCEYIVSLTKGVEDKTLFTMCEIIEDEFKIAGINNDRIVALSGPTHAEEVGRKYPSTIVSASNNIEAAKYVQDIFMNSLFRVYTNDDRKGVEVCAAFKNIIAIASGILSGLSYGDNIKAALLTRGLTEMVRVGEKLNCKKDTFYGLAGIGDMIVTATSIHSRNFQCGKLIGEGLDTKRAIEKIGMVVEGVNFLPKAILIRDKYNVELPISEGVYEIVINGRAPHEILNLLMTRSKKSE